jgi:[heparan sulfate]-glucosamine 3-sulfotransferase 2
MAISLKNRIVWWLLFTASSGLVINTLLVLIKHFLRYQMDIKREQLTDDQICQCDCTTDGPKEFHMLHPAMDYASIAASVPKLDPSYRMETLTRLGSDLYFDVESNCPANSMRRANHANFTPLHLDCPTLFLIGARKGGTSSLYHYLSKHPDFEGTRLDQGPKVGETFYFSSHYETVSWDRYLRLFPSDRVMTGDASVGNLVHCAVPKRLFESCGKQAKVVILLRNPVDRFVSNFLMRARLNVMRIQNTTSISTVLKLQLDTFFHEALGRHVDVINLAKEWSKLSCLFEPAMNMVWEGVYYIHLLNWLCNFPPENILILNSEEFYRKPSVILDQVFQFLGLKRLSSETYEWITSVIYNKGKRDVPAQQRLTEMDRKKLLGAYKQFNAALLELLDWKEVDLRTKWK